METDTAFTQPNPSSTRKLILGLAALLVVVLILLLVVLAHRSSTASIQITSKGFVPATLKVKPGTTVTWNNTDSTVHQIASNPYPANNSLSSLASSGLESGQSYSYTFKNTGTVGYHDQDNPTTLLGEVVVGK